MEHSKVYDEVIFKIDDKINSFRETRGIYPNMLFIGKDLYSLLLDYVNFNSHYLREGGSVKYYKDLKVIILQNKGCYVCDGM